MIRVFTLSQIYANGLAYDFFRILLAPHIQRIGAVPSEPVELLVAVAVDEADPRVVVGFVLYSPVPTHPEACGINYMAVINSHRRRGIGRAMIKELISRYPHTELTCTVKTVPFYESLGFQVLDVHNTQVVMNTRSASTTGMMAIIDVTTIYESQEASEIHKRLVQRWGIREMLRAEKQLERHVAQLQRQARAFVDARMKVNEMSSGS